MVSGRGRVACWRQAGGPMAGAVGMFPGQGLGLGATAVPVGPRWGKVPLLLHATVVTGQGLAWLIPRGGKPPGLLSAEGPGTGTCGAQARVRLPIPGGKSRARAMLWPVLVSTSIGRLVALI